MATEGVAPLGPARDPKANCKYPLAGNNMRIERRGSINNLLAEG